MATRTGGPILEMGCGTGRVLLPLALAGARITGVDVSSEMLARARAKLAAAGAEVRGRAWLVQTDLRYLCLGERYQLAFCALNSFMHLITPEDQVKALRRVHEHLVPGGVLVLDLVNPHPELLNDADGRVMHDFTRPGPGDGCLTTRFHAQRADTGRQILDITFFYDEQARDGVVRRTTAPFALYYLPRREIELRLQTNGYEVEAIYGSYDLDSYWAGSPKLIIVARRA
jgi:SAM-dependent methyltransferase